MPSYLSIDPGLSHTGFAISDSTRLVRPLATIHTKNQKKLLEKTLLIIKQQNPDQIIIGQPMFGPIHFLSRSLFKNIKQQFKGEVHLFSEDLSSKIAIKKLVQSGSRKSSRHFKKHSAAAAVILQDFLETSPLP